MIFCGLLMLEQELSAKQTKIVVNTKLYIEILRNRGLRKESSKTSYSTFQRVKQLSLELKRKEKDIYIT